jgi:hypothetical protein
MKEALQRCYPSSLIMKPQIAAGLSADAPSNSDQNTTLHPEVCTPHPGLAFLPDTPSQQKICIAQEHQPQAQHSKTSSGAARVCGNHERSADAAAADAHLEQFSACLGKGRWTGTFHVEKVTIRQISEASAVLLEHWEAATEGSVHLHLLMHISCTSLGTPQNTNSQVLKYLM